MEIHTKKHGKVTVLGISGKLALGDGDVLLRDTLKALLEAGERLFVFHMTQVPYVDSAGVGEMVGCAKRAYEVGGVVKVVLAPESRVRDLFAITSLDRVFQIFETEEAALDSFSA